MAKKKSKKRARRSKVQMMGERLCDLALDLEVWVDDHEEIAHGSGDSAKIDQIEDMRALADELQELHSRYLGWFSSK